MEIQWKSEEICCGNVMEMHRKCNGNVMEIHWKYEYVGFSFPWKYCSLLPLISIAWKSMEINEFPCNYQASLPNLEKKHVFPHVFPMYFLFFGYYFHLFPQERKFPISLETNLGGFPHISNVFQQASTWISMWKYTLFPENSAAVIQSKRHAQKLFITFEFKIIYKKVATYSFEVVEKRVSG